MSSTKMPYQVRAASAQLASRPRPPSGEPSPGPTTMPTWKRRDSSGPRIWNGPAETRKRKSACLPGRVFVVPVLRGGAQQLVALVVVGGVAALLEGLAAGERLEGAQPDTRRCAAAGRVDVVAQEDDAEVAVDAAVLGGVVHVAHLHRHEAAVGGAHQAAPAAGHVVVRDAVARTRSDVAVGREARCRPARCRSRPRCGSCIRSPRSRRPGRSPTGRSSARSPGSAASGPGLFSWASRVLSYWVSTIIWLPIWPKSSSMSPSSSSSLPLRISSSVRSRRPGSCPRRRWGWAWAGAARWHPVRTDASPWCRSPRRWCPRPRPGDRSRCSSRRSRPGARPAPRRRPRDRPTTGTRRPNRRATGRRGVGEGRLGRGRRADQAPVGDVDLDLAHVHHVAAVEDECAAWVVAHLQQRVGLVGHRPGRGGAANRQREQAAQQRPGTRPPARPFRLGLDGPDGPVHRLPFGPDPVAGARSALPL